MQGKLVSGLVGGVMLSLAAGGAWAQAKAAKVSVSGGVVKIGVLTDMSGLYSDIGGQGSVEAAKVAVAVRMQDKAGKKYLDFHQKLLGGRGQADKARALAVAKEVGMDMKRIDTDLASDEVKLSLEESLKLAETLGLNGTPSYIVGTDVVIGAVGIDALRAKVSFARCGKTAC